MQLNFASSHEVVKYTSELLLPPRRLKPSVAAVQYLRNEKGAYDPRVSPMFEEPLDLLGSRAYTGIVFVGPARSSKTYSLILGGITYIQTCAPGDALIVQMSSDSARDFSRGDLDRCIRNSPELKNRISPRARDDNTYAKHWRTGTSLKIGWPAVSQLSAKTLQYVLITDYDRPECRDNVDGEGPMWDLAQKRVETFMSRGKCLAESSPGEEFNDPNWHPISKHEAPPAPGIMTLYNRGTRARWYWPCLHCGYYFEAKPGIEAFNMPAFEELEKLVKKNDPMTLADKFCHVACPDCGAEHNMANRQAMNMRGVWVHEGQRVDDKGKAVGARRRSNIASFWLGGVAATYQRWDSMIQKYLQGVLTYTRSGDETQLKAMTMTDLGAPYVPRNQAKRRGPEELLNRREEWEKATVPPGVRFLIAAVDVQAHKFVVQVHGWGMGLESWLVDRFDISMSARMESDTRNAALDPAAYTEDWDVLIEEVIKKKYPVAGRPGLTMGMQLVLCDSGGKDGVTMRAYDFWRSLAKHGFQRLFQLVKGDPRLTAPRTHQAFPDTRNRKDRNSKARGDVPVWLLNVNQLKDGVTNDLARAEVGVGYVHLPLWVDEDFFTELTSEVRGPKGWEHKHGTRNEALDLHVYARAGCVMLRAENIDWANPPAWAIDTALRSVDGTEIKPRVDLAALARRLNG